MSIAFANVLYYNCECRDILKICQDVLVRKFLLSDQNFGVDRFGARYHTQTHIFIYVILDQ